MAIKSLFKHHLHLDSGALASGAQMFFYVPGTATPKDTYTTSAGTVANANPVILNSRGEAEIWLDGLYDVDAKTSVATGSAQITGYPVSSVGAGSSNNDANLRWGGTSTGSANAQAISPDPSISSYTIGQSFVFKAGFTNTGATTIAISGLTGIAIQNGGVALVGGEIVVGKLYEVVLDTLTTCQLPNAVTATNQSGGTVAATTGSFSGLITATGGQIKFPATAVPSADANTLDDYEEYASPSTACTGALTIAVVYSLTKIGRLVTLTIPDILGTTTNVANITLGSAIPTEFRPAISHWFLGMTPQINGFTSASPGLVLINSGTGVITLYRDGTAALGWGVATVSGASSVSMSWRV